MLRKRLITLPGIVVLKTDKDVVASFHLFGHKKEFKTESNDWHSLTVDSDMDMYIGPYSMELYRNNSQSADYSSYTKGDALRSRIVYGGVLTASSRHLSSRASMTRHRRFMLFLKTPSSY